MTIAWIIIVIIVIAVIVLFFRSRHVTEAMIISKGMKTMGKVLKSESVRTTDMYGRVHITNYITYEFTDHIGRKWTDRKKVGAKLARKAEGDDITVYYLPKRPEKSTVE